MIDCHNLNFSPKLSEKRIAKAQQILGIRAIKYILCFALYLLGANRKTLANAVGLSLNTLVSFFDALYKDGLVAFEDRRQSSSSLQLPANSRRTKGSRKVQRPASPARKEITLEEQGQYLIVDFGIPNKTLQIPRGNALQVKTVLLTMLHNKFLPKKKVASFLGYTSAHTGNLARKLHQEDISALVEKRQGQQQDYRVGPEVKAELIQQFAVDVVSQGRTSGKQISENLLERCNLNIPARTVRRHVTKLGLPRIKKSLPQMLAEVKKNFKQ